jgi:molybdopterin molybdotransferase
MSSMIPFERAEEIVLGSARFLGSEEVSLATCLHRILAGDVRADLDQPPFDKAAMDGFACRRRDLPGPLTIIETIAAGAVPSRSIGPSQCARIMTGAPVPTGADCVVKIEDIVENPDGIMRFTGMETTDNICLRGEDIRTGQIVLSRGERLAPQHIAVLASVGCARVPVARRPRVGIIGTGDELVEPHCTPASGQIRNSNGPQLSAQVLAAGAEPVYRGIAADTVDGIGDVLKKALADCDVVLLSGGVSMGDFDFVPRVMRDCGLEILFDRVAIKPGKPTTFGLAPGRWCFGLPGNPVSTFLLCEILVKPLLARLMGCESKDRYLPARLGAPVSRRKTGRQSWLPVAFSEDGMVRPLVYHGSAHINALCRADGFLVIPAGTAHIPEGTQVHVRPLPAPH